MECNYHIVTGQTQAAKTILYAVRRAGLELADLVVEPFASAAAVLSEPEMEAGVALVDIGGGTTDICIFEDGSIRHTAIIPIGGDRITKDIQEAFGILREQAEIVKLTQGSCYPTEKMKTDSVLKKMEWLLEKENIDQIRKGITFLPVYSAPAGTDDSAGTIQDSVDKERV